MFVDPASRSCSLIYDWNCHGRPELPKKIALDDETLRDGLQSPSVKQPNIEQKIELLHLMNELGIDIADIGLPGAGAKVARDVEILAWEIADNRLNIKAGCAARTVIADIAPILAISQRVGIPIEVQTFIGSSPVRQYVEGWDIDIIRKNTRDAVTFAASHGCPVMYVTEDTTRSNPETLKILLSEAIECGATRVCLCDTVGHATPNGIKALVQFVKHDIIGARHGNNGEETPSEVQIDFHGHSDRGLGLANALAAIEAGADRVHGTALGIGERAGNAPMDLLLVNLKLLGLIKQDLSKLKRYCEAAAEYCGFSIAANYPVIGHDAFRTGTGVHAAAIIKSFAKEEDRWLSDVVYSGVCAKDFGYRQVIEVGPLSGKSNVQYWLKDKGIDFDQRMIDALFEAAKNSSRIMSDYDIYKAIVERVMLNRCMPNALATEQADKGEIHANN